MNHLIDKIGLMLKISVFILFAVFVAFYSLHAQATERDVGWNLAPHPCGRLNTGADGVVVVSQISAGSDAMRPSAWIDVTEEANYKMQWLTSFTRLHAGDEFVVGGEIYEISSISVVPIHMRPYEGNVSDPGANCAPNESSASVQDTKSHIFVGDQVGMILPADTVVTLKIGGGACVMALSFEPARGEQPVASLEWHAESTEPWKRCDKSGSASGVFGINDVLDIHEYGRFRIKMIIPRTKNHPDWMVLVKDRSADRGTDRGHP
jgi:hypothetical protein